MTDKPCARCWFYSPDRQTCGASGAVDAAELVLGFRLPYAVEALHMRLHPDRCGRDGKWFIAKSAGRAMNAA
jgi:hypothetical protein